MNDLLCDADWIKTGNSSKQSTKVVCFKLEKFNYITEYSHLGISTPFYNILQL